MLFSEAYDLYSASLFRGVDNKSIAAFFEEFPLVNRTFAAGEIIIHQGDETNQIGIITGGQATVNKYHYDGTVQLLQIIEKGDYIGLEAVSSSFLTSPYTIVSSDVCSVSIFSYANYIASPYVDDKYKISVMRNVINILADDSIRKMYKIDILSKRSLRSRILTYLSIICEKRKTNEINIGMTQEQFANYLCVNRSVLSAELNRMKREGLIDYSGKIYKVLFRNSFGHIEQINYKTTAE